MGRDSSHNNSRIGLEGVAACMLTEHLGLLPAARWPATSPAIAILMWFTTENE